MFKLLGAAVSTLLGAVSQSGGMLGAAVERLLRVKFAVSVKVGLLTLLLTQAGMTLTHGQDGGCEPLPLDTIYEPDADFISFYLALQWYMEQTFATPIDAFEEGYVIPTHGFVVLTDNGFVLSNSVEIPGAGQGPSTEVDPGSPNLLFYAPTGGPTRIGSRRGSFVDQIPDPPYRLIGWGYVVDYEPGTPPEMVGVPAEAWFVHEAGWHLLDGGFKSTPPRGEDPCEKGRLDIEQPPRFSRPRNGLVWHERAWDLHMWAGPDGLPVITYPEPFAQLPARTLAVPDGAFFFPLSTSGDSTEADEPEPVWDRFWDGSILEEIDLGFGRR